MIALAVLILLLAVCGGLAFGKWAFFPSPELPRNRVRYQNLRLHLHLHPGRGHASTAELHRHWGRRESARKANYARPNLTRAERLTRPAEHSVFLGRAQYRHAVRLPIQEHALFLAPPRSYKTATLSRIVLHYPGPVLPTSTRADVYKEPVRARAAIGRPDVFNPQAVGGIPSTVRFDVIAGCEDPRGHPPGRCVRRGCVKQRGRRRRVLVRQNQRLPAGPVPGRRARQVAGP